MNFSFQRQLRLAAVVGETLGLILSSPALFWGSIAVFIFSYQMSVSKMERELEKKENKREEE